jgi:iron complex transport system permease protein
MTNPARSLQDAVEDTAPGVLSPAVLFNEDRRTRRLFWALSGLTCLAFLASLLVGPAGLSPPESLAALLGRGGVNGEAHRLILREIRLPRALLGLLIGAALGLSGAALQGYLRNPLAEPGLIGVSGGAVLGAVVAIHSGLAGSFALALPLAGLTGGLAAAAGVVLLSGIAGGPLTLILGGVAITSLTGALTSLALNLSANPYAATEMVFWMLGSLTDRSMTHVALAAPFIVPGLIALLASARSLDALSLGEDVAQTLGVEPGWARALVLAGTALSVGAATAVAGSIGFVGLVVPHVLRPFVGNSPGRLLPVSALGGAALVLVADVGVRLIPWLDLKLGVLTSLIGAPFFLWLVIKTRREIGP